MSVPLVALLHPKRTKKKTKRRIFVLSYFALDICLSMGFTHMEFQSFLAPALTKPSDVERWRAVQKPVRLVAQVLTYNTLILIIHEAELTVTKPQAPLRMVPGCAWTQGDWPSHLEVRSVTCERAGAHYTGVGLERTRQGEGGLPCTSTSLPSGVEFLFASIIQQPS